MKSDSPIAAAIRLDAAELTDYAPGWPYEVGWPERQGPPSRGDMLRYAGSLGETILLSINDPEYKLEYVYSDARLAASRALEGRYHVEMWCRDYALMLEAER